MFGCVVAAVKRCNAVISYVLRACTPTPARMNSIWLDCVRMMYCGWVWVAVSRWLDEDGCYACCDTITDVCSCVYYAPQWGLHSGEIAAALSLSLASSPCHSCISSYVCGISVIQHYDAIQMYTMRSHKSAFDTQLSELGCRNRTICNIKLIILFPLQFGWDSKLDSVARQHYTHDGVLYKTW